VSCMFMARNESFGKSYLVVTKQSWHSLIELSSIIDNLIPARPI
jgi:hypothetical protein